MTAHKKETTLALPEIPPPERCKDCGKKNRRYATKSNGSGKRYYNLVCSTCRTNERRRQVRAIQATMAPEEVFKLNRNERLRRKYKITVDEYDAILETQDGVCDICKTKKGTYNMPVDHDHITGENRGILCHWCNKGIGNFFDDPKLLESAIQYLTKWNKNGI